MCWTLKTSFLPSEETLQLHYQRAQNTVFTINTFFPFSYLKHRQVSPQKLKSSQHSYYTRESIFKGFLLQWWTKMSHSVILSQCVLKRGAVILCVYIYIHTHIITSSSFLLAIVHLKGLPTATSEAVCHAAGLWLQSREQHVSGYYWAVPGSGNKGKWMIWKQIYTLSREL